MSNTSPTALLLTGHVDVTVTPRTTRLLVDEINDILRSCHLPVLPEDLSDVILASG